MTYLNPLIHSPVLLFALEGIIYCLKETEGQDPKHGCVTDHTTPPAGLPEVTIYGLLPWRLRFRDPCVRFWTYEPFRVYGPNLEIIWWATERSLLWDPDDPPLRKISFVWVFLNYNRKSWETKLPKKFFWKGGIKHLGHYTRSQLRIRLSSYISCREMTRVIRKRKSRHTNFFFYFIERWLTEKCLTFLKIQFVVNNPKLR